MRFARIVSGVFVVAVLVAGSPVIAATGNAEGSSAGRTRVVCVGSGASKFYSYRPHNCDLLMAGAPPIGLAITYTRTLHWTRWSRSSAIAHGKLGVQSYGLARLKLRLFRPVTACGHRVFSLARVAYRVRVNGRIRREFFVLDLSKCR